MIELCLFGTHPVSEAMKIELKTLLDHKVSDLASRHLAASLQRSPLLPPSIRQYFYDANPQAGRRLSVTLPGWVGDSIHFLCIII